MQTLNVGAGRTDEEYRAAEEQRRAELRDDIRMDAYCFFAAAGAAAIGTGVFPVRLNLLVSVGVVDLLALYGGAVVPAPPLGVPAATALRAGTPAGVGLSS